MNTVYIIPKSVDPYGFAKQILSKKFNITDFEIDYKANGKPYLKNLPDFYFNISHSNKMQAVAVGDCEIGVDIEFLRKVDLRVARRFTKEEYDYITEADSDMRFFEIWTKKEAYLKYTGDGILGGLNSANVLKSPIPIKTYFKDGYVISVCCEKEVEVKYEI